MIIKKISLALAFVLLGLTAYASVATYSVIEITKIVQEDYTEISTASLPTIVKTALSKAYPSAKLEKVYVNEKKEYKLEITQDGQKTTVYLDDDGRWLKI